MNEAYLKAIVNGHCDEDLDILVNDEDPYVRKAVAERGRDKDLDILVNDEDPNVRKPVAERGRDKDLDILVNDEDPDVRKAVAERGRDKDLDILVNDKNCSVRKAVAERENFNEHPSAAEEVEVPSDFMSYVDAVIEEAKQERQALTARQIKPTIMQGDEH